MLATFNRFTRDPIHKNCNKLQLSNNSDCQMCTEQFIKKAKKWGERDEKEEFDLQFIEFMGSKQV